MLEIVTTISSLAIRSSILISPASSSIDVLRSSPYLSLTSISSSLMICILLGSSAKISFKSAIVAINSAYSALTLSISRPVSFWSLISKIAFACISDSLNSFIKPFLASSPFLDARISFITASRLSRAIINPSKI